MTGTKIMNETTVRRRRALVVGTLIAVSAFGAVSHRAMAGSATGTLGVSLTINAGCTVASTPVAFTAQGVISSTVNNTGTVSVVCTNTTPYNVELDEGAGASASVTARKMTGPGSATVAYALYQDSGHSTNWGKTDNTDTASGTGNGTTQALTVYGQILSQTTPAPGSYADTVNVTVTF